MNLDYFWTNEYDLPPNVGFPHWGWEHICCLLVSVAMIILLSRGIHSANERIKTRILHAIPVLMLLMECGKYSTLAITGHLSIGYLPLHLCSMGVPLFLLTEYFPNEKWKRIFAEISLILIVPGSAAAMVFPDWNMYPMLSFMNFYGWMWHALLILYPVLLFRERGIRPQIRHYYYSVLFLMCVVPPVYLFDKRFQCNYFFINWPLKETPLEFFAGFLGVPGYLLGFAALMMAVMLLMYGIYAIPEIVKN